MVDTSLDVSGGTSAEELLSAESRMRISTDWEGKQGKNGQKLHLRVQSWSVLSLLELKNTELLMKKDVFVFWGK